MAFGPFSTGGGAAKDLIGFTKEELLSPATAALLDGCATPNEALATLRKLLDKKAASTHAAQHASNGSDPITPASIGALGAMATAAAATILATARTIQTNLASTAAASFNGSANVTPGVTGTLPIANGGTGNTTGLAASATKLATARTIRTNLASTATASFDGSANVAPGVTGILPVANGGTGVSSLETLFTNAKGARIATGSYVGTGTYGAANPNSITFDFVPKFVFVMRDSNPFGSGGYRAVWISGLSFQNTDLYMGLNGKTLSWYTASRGASASEQLNSADETFHWVALY